MDKQYKRSYKDKYVSVRDIYNAVKGDIKKIGYSGFYNIIKTFFEELIHELVVEKATVTLPAKFGKVYIKKMLQKRAFHYRCNVNELDEEGKRVVYKVPILNDYYYKLVWLRPKKYKTAKIIPMGYFKRTLNKELNEGKDF